MNTLLLSIHLISLLVYLMEFVFFFCGHFHFCPICHQKNKSSLFCTIINLRLRSDFVSPWLHTWCYSICNEQCNGRPVWWRARVCTLLGEADAAPYWQRTLLCSPACCSRLCPTAWQFLEATFEVSDRRPCQQGQLARTDSGTDPLHPLVAASKSILSYG